MIIVPYGAARFAPLDARQPEGPQVAVLWGDPEAGPSAMLLKIPMGTGILHHHTADYHLLVLEGRMKHWSKGQQEADAEVLAPGSYWFQPGRQVHGDSCLSKECVMFIKWSRARDAIVADDIG